MNKEDMRRLQGGNGLGWSVGKVEAYDMDCSGSEAMTGIWQEVKVDRLVFTPKF